MAKSDKTDVAAGVILGQRILKEFVEDKVFMLDNGKFATQDPSEKWVTRNTLEAAKKAQLRKDIPRELVCFRTGSRWGDGLDASRDRIVVVGRRGHMLVKKRTSGYGKAQTESISSSCLFLLDTTIEAEIIRLHKAYAAQIGPLKKQIEKLEKDRDNAREKLEKKLVSVSSRNVVELLDKQAKGEL